MAKQLGTNATFEVSLDGVTWLKPLRVKKASGFNSKVDLIDATDNDDGGWSDNVAGLSKIEFTVTLNFDPSDYVQRGIIVQYKNTKQPLFVRYRSRGAGTGLDQTYGLSLLEEATFDSENNKLQELMVKGKNKGQWTESVQ